MSQFIFKALNLFEVTATGFFRAERIPENIQVITAAQFIIAKYWKQPKCPSATEWIKKLWYTYTMEFYTAERKKELIPFATAWMELESIMLSEISQVVKDKYHMISPLTGT